MAAPTLVKVYRPQPTTRSGGIAAAPALPPVSAYAFADILRAADGPELQSGIEGMAEICAKNRMSLAENSASHIQPVGVIDEASSRRIKPHLRKPGMRRALTSVPEGSSGSSEGSRGSKRRYIFGPSRAPWKETVPRVIRLGSMGRKISTIGTAAVAEAVCETSPAAISGEAMTQSAAIVSLQHVLDTFERPGD